MRFVIVVGVVDSVDEADSPADMGCPSTPLPGCAAESSHLNQLSLWKESG
ncbi:MAG: hypothetical protein QY302_18435 [Anaerolineales bacterium]|nr:MAG: hypothetical protein QY302_18435 [Anaerolineales bacterium]